MKKNSRWPDYLFTLAVRFICGLVMGCLASVLLAWKWILREFSHNQLMKPLVLVLLCGAIGSLAGAFTIPEWQTPWYKGIRDERDERTQDVER